MMRKKDARYHAKKMLIISDIHGCLEALLQPLIQSGIVREIDGARKHVGWNEGVQDTCVLIAGDISDRGLNSTWEMKHEELLILSHIEYLNNTHSVYHNPISVILGNHCYNNLIGYPPSHTSAQCIQHMRENYCKEKFPVVYKDVYDHDGKFKLKKSRMEVEGRQGFFLYHSPLSRKEIVASASDIVLTGKVDVPLFFRDFVNFDVACYFPVFDLLAVHGGIDEQHLADIKNWGVSEWCLYVNNLCKDAIVSHRNNEYVSSLLNNRSYASNEPCDYYSSVVSWHVIGHSIPVNNEQVHCNVIRADMRNNAYSQCTKERTRKGTEKGTKELTKGDTKKGTKNGTKEDKICTIKPRYVIFDENGPVVKIGKALSTAKCVHNILAFRCGECKSMWQEDDFFPAKTEMRRVL